MQTTLRALVCFHVVLLCSKFEMYFEMSLFLYVNNKLYVKTMRLRITNILSTSYYDHYGKPCNKLQKKIKWYNNGNYTYTQTYRPGGRSHPTTQNLTLGTKPVFWHHHPPLFIVYTINQRRPSLACVHSAGPALPEQVFLNIHCPVCQQHRSEILYIHISICFDSDGTALLKTTGVMLRCAS